MASIVVVTVIWNHSRTVGSKHGAVIARSISSMSRWALLVLAAVLAACSTAGGGTGY